MNMEFKRKLPIPAEIKEMYPISEEGMKAKKLNDQKLYDIFTGQSDKFLLVIGPCSADREDALLQAPDGVCFDTDGNMYVGDTHNYRIRKVVYE